MPALIRNIIVALAAVLGLTVTTAPAAQASCGVFGCSSVSNYSWSDASVWVARYWQGQYYNSGGRKLYPGQNSRRYWNDVNAFMVPNGCYAYNPQRGTFYGGRWYRPKTSFAYGLDVRC